MLKKCPQSDNEKMYKADDWSDECLEYLYNRKIWLPGFVRTKTNLTVIFF